VADVRVVGIGNHCKPCPPIGLATVAAYELYCTYPYTAATNM
jgi:hypothetical protein